MKEGVLDKRLARQAERLGVPLEEARVAVLELGLDAAKERREQKAMAEAMSASLLLVTATDTEHRELRAVALSLGHSFERRTGRSGTVYYHLGQVGNERVASIRVKMGAFGSEGSAAKCIWARAETGATTLILMGTAFGVSPEQQHIGDVLVSDAIFLYDDCHVVDAGRESGYVLRYPTARKHASASWVERFRQTAVEFEKRGETERVMVGTLLSGGARIESAQYRNELISRIPAMDSPIIGGEMEAMGIVSASTAIDEPGWVVVKGISDFADAASRAEDQLKRSRVRAARSSAGVVLQTLRFPAIDLY